MKYVANVSGLMERDDTNQQSCGISEPHAFHIQMWDGPEPGSPRRPGIVTKLFWSDDVPGCDDNFWTPVPFYLLKKPLRYSDMPFCGMRGPSPLDVSRMVKGIEVFRKSELAMGTRDPSGAVAELEDCIDELRDAAEVDAEIPCQWVLNEEGQPMYVPPATVVLNDDDEGFGAWDPNPLGADSDSDSEDGGGDGEGCASVFPVINQGAVSSVEEDEVEELYDPNVIVKDRANRELVCPPIELGRKLAGLKLTKRADNTEFTVLQVGDYICVRVDDAGGLLPFYVGQVKSVHKYKPSKVPKQFRDLDPNSRFVEVCWWQPEGTTVVFKRSY